MKRAVKRIVVFILALVLTAGILSQIGVCAVSADGGQDSGVEENIIPDNASFTYEHDPMQNPKAARDILPDENAIYGFVPNPEGKLAQYAVLDFSDPTVVAEMRADREAYHESVKELENMVISMRSEGKNIEEIARAVSTRRNEIRIESYKDDPEGLAILKERNLKEYGNENGGTPEFFYEKYGSWDVVAEKSMSVNMGADAVLGLYDKYYNTYFIAKSLNDCCEISAIKPVAYTGDEIKPEVVVRDNEKVLTEGKDYTLSFSDNIEAGKATVTVVGNGDYEGTLSTAFDIKKAKLKYRAYVQKKQWMNWVTASMSGTDASGMAGTTDELRMETIQLRLSGVDGNIRYRAYVQKKGWTQWAETGNPVGEKAYAGTKGQSRRVEMIQIQSKGEVAELYDIYYRAYAEKYGWLGWAKNGGKAGTAGYAYKLEAFQINLLKKGEEMTAESQNAKSFYSK